MTESGVTDVWTRGDYPAIARLFEPGARELVQALGADGAHVIDVAAGTGNAAVAAIAAGAARVTLVDSCVPLLDLARDRLADSPVPARVLPGDCHRLPVEDAAGTRVLSSFGVVYADEPRTAAAELVRVCAPGGWIGLTAFAPDAAPGCFRGVLAALLDTPIPRRSPARPADWVEPETLAGFFTGTGAELHSVTDLTMELRFGSAAEAAGFFEDKSGPILEVREHLEAQGHWPRAHRELLAAFTRTGHQDERGFVVPAPYRLALLHRPQAQLKGRAV